MPLHVNHIRVTEVRQLAGSDDIFNDLSETLGDISFSYFLSYSINATQQVYLFCQRTVGATLHAAGMPLTPTTQFPALNNDELLFVPIRKHEISSALTVSFHTLLLIYQLTSPAGQRTSPGHLWPPSRFRMCGAGSRERRNASFPGQLQLDASSSSGSAVSLGKIGGVVTVTSMEPISSHNFERLLTTR